MLIAISTMLLHRPRAIVMPSHEGRACRGTMQVLRGCWTFAGVEPWSPPWPRNDNWSSARPRGSNADEWQLFLAEHHDALPFLAVQIAEAIDAAARA